MRRTGRALAWMAASLTAALALSVWLQDAHWAALLVAGLAILTVPPVKAPVILRLVALPAAIGIAVLAWAGTGRTSIYDSPSIRERFHAIYDAELARWPVPFESLVIETRYGPVHVIASGETGRPPMLLLHASGMASWSWKYNIADLSRDHRVYAVDLIGDAGKSEYRDLSDRMRSGRDQADHYAAIMDGLGVARAPVVGASEGGFIATNLALYHPERVEKLILLGPMGYSGALRSVLRIMVAQLFPVRPVLDATFRWALSDSPALREDYAEWFPLVMTGVFPAKVPPLPFSAEERRAIGVPVLFVFGTRDRLVGDPERAADRVADVPLARVAVVEAGHLMAGDAPAEIDRLILDFLAE